MSDDNMAGLDTFDVGYNAATLQSQKRIAELEQQVAERDAMLEEKDAALAIADEYLTARVSNNGITSRTIVLPAVKQALAKTLPSEALDRVLAAEREKIAFYVDDELDNLPIADKIRSLK